MLGERLWLGSLLGTSVAYLAGSFFSPWSGEGLPGTGSTLFPRTIGLLLVLTIAIALVGTVRRAHRTAPAEPVMGIDPDGAELDVASAHGWTTAASMIAVASFIVLFITVGALTAIAVFATVSFVLLARMRWWLAPIAGIVTAIIIQLVFVVWLGVRMPTALLI